MQISKDSPNSPRRYSVLLAVLEALESVLGGVGKLQKSCQKIMW